MPFAQKLILHSPVSDVKLLKVFMEQCLADGVSLLAIAGSEALEEIIDWLVIADGSDPSRFLCTTSHPSESLDEVLSMASAWDAEKGGDVD
jgi:hypothetical protein